jgi:hypothetical protein
MPKAGSVAAVGVAGYVPLADKVKARCRMSGGDGTHSRSRMQGADPGVSVANSTHALDVGEVRFSTQATCGEPIVSSK